MDGRKRNRTCNLWTVSHILMRVEKRKLHLFQLLQLVLRIKRAIADWYRHRIYMADIFSTHRSEKLMDQRAIRSYIDRFMTYLSTAYHKCFPSLTKPTRENKLGVGGEDICV